MYFLIKATFSIIFISSFHLISFSQDVKIDWYSESVQNDIVIQNSYPKGGPYEGPTTEHYS